MSINRNNLISVLVPTLFGIVIGAIYTKLVYLSDGTSEGSVWIGVGIGGMIAFLISSFEVFIVSKPYSYLRRLPFWLVLVLRTAVHFAIIYFAIRGNQLLYTAITGVQLDLIGSGTSSVLDLAFSALVVFIVVFYMQMRLFIGGRNLNNLMIGRYNRPRSEERIFMIMDVVGSTRLAQRVGDEAFHRYLNEIFALADDPIHENGGEVHSYVGDAIFAVWPATDNPTKNARLLRAVSDIHAIVQFNAPRIEKKFGIRPEVRIAIHRGPVVVGETGYRKRQITYLGNTLNLASRMEGLTRTGIGTYLASRSFVEETEVPQNIELAELGSFEIKGSHDPMELFGIKIN